MPPSDGTLTTSSCRPNDAGNSDSISNETRTTLKALLASMDGLSTTGVRRSRASIAARATACHYQLSQPQQQPQPQPQPQQQPDTTNESDSNIQKPADNIFDRVASMVGRSLQDEVRASSPICEYEEVLDDQKYSLRISMPVHVVMQSTLQEEAAATTRATTTATTRRSHRLRRGRRPRPSNDSSGILTSSLNHREGPPIRGIRSANLEDELVGAKVENDDTIDNDNDNDEDDIEAKDGAGDDCSLTCALSNESSTLNSTIPNSFGDDSRSRFHFSLDTDTTDGNGHQQSPPTFEADSCICERDGWYTLSTIIDEEIAKKEKSRKWYR